MVSWRRRRKTEGTGQEVLAEDGGADPGDGDDGGPDGRDVPQEELAESEDARRAALETRRTQVGPFDAAEVSPDHGGVDLGALRLDPPPGAELRLEVEADGQRVVAATLVSEGSSVQVHVFAAPRTAGVWDEVREEIATSVAAQGGATQEVEVPDGFGRELLVRMPATTPDGQEGFTLSRFSGVDGPRWFLRAVFSGPAAVERAAAAPLEAAVRSAVVVRGADAMAPRELLALSLPQGAVQALPADVDGGGAGSGSGAGEGAL